MTKEIPLTQGYVALVDDEDFEKVNKFKWHASVNKTNGKHYAVRFDYSDKQRKKKVYMHRFLMEVTSRYVLVDHVDGESLDCRRHNMRKATKTQNNQNTRKRPNSIHSYKGIVRAASSWAAQIHALGSHKYLGCFLTAEEAARAYDAAALFYYGEFANLNFPQSCALA